MQLQIDREYFDKISDRLFKKKLAKLLFDLINEVRVLKGQQPITKAQFINYLKSL